MDSSQHVFADWTERIFFIPREVESDEENTRYDVYRHERQNQKSGVV